MASSVGTRLLSTIDCPGGGQVWVDGTTLYIGHMRAPSGTTVVDVADPLTPRVLATIEVPKGLHSHKVRAANGLMLVNHEGVGSGAANAPGGLAIYDVTRPAAPRLIHKWETPGGGVHRYDFDGRHAYISPTAEGYTGNIAMILDLADPARPVEVSRMWAPGQWTAGGEVYPPGADTPLRCHHPLRLGDRLHVSYWHGGFFTYDISDLSRPRQVAHFNTGPAFPHPTHTCLPVPQPLLGRRVMVVADEDVAALRPTASAFSWVFDITEETTPIPISTIRVPGLDRDGAPTPKMTGCHQPSERFAGTIIPFAWFAQGLRLFDIADPFAPREIGHYLPDPPGGEARASSNDVTMDDRGLIYLIDRIRGVQVIEAEALR